MTGFTRALIIVFIFGISCQRPPDLPPFIITATVLDNSTSVQLDWPLVEDSRIGPVRYDLYLENTLIASNLNAITYTINNLNYNTTYNGTLVGKTLAGDTESAAFSFTTGKEYIAIPDAGLEQVLISEGFDTEGISNGKMVKVDALLVKNLKANNKNISIVEGIQHFVNLEVADLSNNQISQINLSQNLKVSELNLGSNKLSNLNISPNINLRYLYVFKNTLSQLNINQNTKLEVLVAEYNNLSSVDISRNIILNTLGLGHNVINQINLSANQRLIDLDLSYNPISVLNLSATPLLLNLVCQSCNLTGIGVGNLTNLVYLDVSKNSITSISLTNNFALKTLNVSNNNLNTLNLKNNPNLSILNTENNNNLSQICVLNVSLAQSNGDWVKDVSTTFSSNCN